MAHYHFIGIGGAGLSAIARVLLESGNQVSGSDLVISPSAEELRAMGVEVYAGHATANVAGADLIIRSSAIPESNVEVEAGKNTGIRVIKRVDFLAELTAGKRVIAVAGTHGKTTTTAMLAWCLTEAGKDPSYVIGGVSKNLGCNAHAGKGEFFVIEADEYDHMFLGLRPEILVVTTVEHDHPDCYPTPEDYFNEFVKLTGLIQPNGCLIADGSHAGANRLLSVSSDNFTKISYGENADADVRISDINHQPGQGVSFDIRLPQQEEFKVTLPLPGKHNAHNAAAAICVFDQLGLSMDLAISALARYTGSGRRYDLRATINNITLIDDYAHHPTEIRATLAAARSQYPEREIWAVWQPHTYSRTRELLNDFSKAFDDCDHVIVSDIYASREKPQEFSSTAVVSRMQHKDAHHIGELKDISDYLAVNLKPGHVLLVLSAGDADQITRTLANRLGEKESK
jgi:UDP-N-acetylmuramate--alanine ligase